jgi:hypothetical protein
MARRIAGGCGVEHGDRPAGRRQPFDARLEVGDEILDCAALQGDLSLH